MGGSGVGTVGKACGVALLAVATSGCSKPHDAPSTAASVPVIASQAAPAPKPSPAASTEAAATSTASAAPAPCALAPGYRGQVFGVNVFARLGLEGPRLHGRYFYEHVGSDIALQGTATPGGGVHLVEGDPKTPTGTFDGACTADGAIEGSWTGAGKGKTGRFRLVPVPRGGPPVVATRRFSASGRAQEVGPFGMKSCKYDESWVELFGLADAAVERAMAKQGLEVRRGPVLDKDGAAEVEKCETGLTVEFEEHFVSSFREIATLESSGSRSADGAAHPDNAINFTRTSYDLRTGKPITSKDLFTRKPDPLVLSCVVKSQATDQLPREFWTDRFSDPGLDLTEHGVHFYGADYPHFAAVLTGQGPILAYDVLLRDGYLRSDSAAARAWSGVKPAAKDEDPCEHGWE